MFSHDHNVQDQKENEYRYNLKGHYNEQGYKLVAETILKKLNEFEYLEK